MDQKKLSTQATPSEDRHSTMGKAQEEQQDDHKADSSNSRTITKSQITEVRAQEELPLAFLKE